MSKYNLVLHDNSLFPMTYHRHISPLTEFALYSTMFPRIANMRQNLEKRIKAVETYHNGGTLQNVALHFGIHHVTLCRWVQWYKLIMEEDSSQRIYQKPWNRPSRELETEVMLLKEKNPSITLRQACAGLVKKGISISIKGIYNIWLRYNLVNRSLDDVYSPFGSLTYEALCALKQVELLLENNKNDGTMKKAAKILNDLPAYPAHYEDLIQKIPERFLSPRRRMDWLYAQFLEIPIPLFLKKIKKLRCAFEKKHLFYSSILAGLLEILALHWMRTPEQELKLNQLLRKRMGNLRDPALNLALTFLAATAHAELLQAKKAHCCVQKCKQLLRSLHNPRIDILLADLLTFTSDYKDALKFYYRALAMEQEPKTYKRLLAKTAVAAVIAGKYQETSARFLSKLKLKPQDDYYVSFALVKALLYVGLGEIDKATFFLKQCLETSEKEQLRNFIFTTATCLATINKALGKIKESKKVLKKYLPLMKKYSVKRETFIIEYLLDERMIDKKTAKFPIFHLLMLFEKARKTLRARYYKQVLDYSKHKGLYGFFQRMCIFFPEPVLTLLKKGKRTGLPQSILKLPVFNEELPVYYVKFLGKVIIYKNQRYLKTKLTPKEEALLIALAQRLSEPEKFIPIAEIYQNFWRNSKNPSSRLSHFLVQLKRKLRMPKYLIRIYSRNGEKILVNKGFYVTTDYSDFDLILAEAQALERVGEWSFARDKYLQAFNLIRSAPCRRMYDNWSDRSRRAILNRLESMAQHFIKMCMRHQNKRDIEKITRRISQITI